MVQLSIIEAKLTKLGVRKTFFVRPEIRELHRVLMDNEEIIKCVPGRYHGGFALLVTTNIRLLLVDKKPMYLNVEDIRYDMISEVHISSRLFDATITLFTVNKQLAFSSYRQQLLRDLTGFVQQRVTEIRQHHQEPAPELHDHNVAVPSPLPHAAQTYTTTDYSQGASDSSSRQSLLDSMRQHHLVPSVDVHKIVGAAAIRASRRRSTPNPYTRGPLLVKQNWSSFIK